ncbi:CPBP family intramembrane glutamic endopeptidase [uncultured Chryseobacterium sp.]|uniref:CPBP family intramembrane glutamic endopeptidase n=1 Tax=uncultured Chryseobacterium sp. TaxID=259322 RepID=UPI0025DF6D9A|nr:CPBP family intramembrane glutamic endopeptidase [uncultured Chryseobacterium sp.]
MNYFLRLKNDAAGLWHFIQKPNDDQIHISPKNRFLLIFNLLLIEVILHFIIVFPCNYLVENVITVQETYPLSNLTLLNLFLLAVITAPLLEEILFRYSLRYHQLFSRFISREKWNRIFPYLVYFSAVAFGFVHLGNYVNDSWKFYALSPLIIISQLSGGFILSYIRIRLNILYSLLYHALWNMLFAIVVPFVILFFTPPFTAHTSYYSIRIEQEAFLLPGDAISLEANIQDDKIYNLKADHYQLQYLLDYLYGINHHITDEDMVNIRFTSKKGISKEEFLDLLKKNYKIKEK